MKHLAALVAVCLLVVVSPLQAQDSKAPIDSGVDEKVQVSLMLVDTLVLDKNGKTVPDLAKDDFELKIGDKTMKVDTFDVNCPIGSADDPIKNARAAAKKGDLQPIGPGIKRKIVFVFDYYFLQIPNRQYILNAADTMLKALGTDDEEIMIVALAWGVRVQQKFTTDRKALSRALTLMEHDKSLWAFEFTLGASGKEYFDDLTTLMDVLEAYSGPKAIVYFSEVRSVSSSGSRNDNWFNDVTMHAAASRTAVYPVYAAGLGAGAAMRSSDTLARLANQTGGRMTMMSEDLSVPYRRAQRDLSCRYTLGAYVDPEDGYKRRNVRVHLKETQHELRYPEMIKFFTDEDRKQSRQRAAFVDPGPYENPVVRAMAFPAHPLSTTSWDTLLAVNFPMPYRAGGGNVDIQATLKRGATRVEKFKNTFFVGAGDEPGKERPVVIFGDTKIKSGQYDFTVVLSEPKGAEIVSARTAVNVPVAHEGLLILRGPLMAKVAPGGKLIRADAKEKDEPTKLDEVLGEGNSFEPLIVHEISSSDELLIYWNACIFGKSELKSDAVVQRRFLDDDGKVVHEWDAIPLNLESAGKKLVCHDDLERLGSKKLAPGEYNYEVSVTYKNSGDLIAQSTAPLLVD